jgi:peroxiredoxin Q/BCP
VLGISVDAPAANKAFKEKFSFPFDLLSDETRAVALAYGAVDDLTAKTAKRISYLIGPDGKIRKAYATVKAADHPEQVLGDL